VNPTPQPVSASAAPAVPLLRRRILVIDDERAFGEMVRLNLERTGLYVVEIETNSTTAVATARQFLPHLVLLNVIMPGADGGDVCRRLRADPVLAQVPVLFLTATVSPRETAGEPVPRGGMRFLSKPIPRRRLVAAIEEALGTTVLTPREA